MLIHWLTICNWCQPALTRESEQKDTSLDWYKLNSKFFHQSVTSNLHCMHLLCSTARTDTDQIPSLVTTSWFIQYESSWQIQSRTQYWTHFAQVLHIYMKLSRRCSAQIMEQWGSFLLFSSLQLKSKTLIVSKFQKSFQLADPSFICLPLSGHCETKLVNLFLNFS